MMSTMSTISKTTNGGTLWLIALAAMFVGGFLVFSAEWDLGSGSTVPDVYRDAVEGLTWYERELNKKTTEIYHGLSYQTDRGDEYAGNVAVEAENVLRDAEKFMESLGSLEDLTSEQREEVEELYDALWGQLDWIREQVESSDESLE